MKAISLKFLLILFLFTSFSSAQLSDLARIDYTFLPKRGSGIEYSRIRGLFNFPVKLNKNDSYLLLGLDYSNINLTMEENSSFDIQEIGDFQLLNLNIGYTYQMNENWRVGIRITPGFNSNLTAGQLNFEDVSLSSDLIFIKDKTKDETLSKPYRLMLGVSYSDNRGFPFPLPFVSYYKRLHPKWSFNIGIPKSNLQYHISEKNRLKLYSELDGFTSNIQQGLVVDNASVAESINLSLIVAGLQYEYHLIDNLEFYLRTSYLLSNNLKLSDGNRNRIIKLDNNNVLYFRIGLRFKI